MRSLSISTIIVCCLSVASQSEVIPIVLDGPLALQPDPIVGVTAPATNFRALDAWLNIRINSDTTGQVQNEQQVVVNALDPNNVVAAWRDFRLGYRRVGVGRSFDGGSTWEDELFFEPTYEKQSDPGLTWHTSGSIYAVVLSFTSGGEDGIFVSETTDGGLNWGPFIPAVSGIPGSFEDKELMACDRSGSQYDGNLYIA